MARRHTLGVAASTLALAVSCIAGALPASATTNASFPTTVSIAAAPSAEALPSDAEIQEAKKDESSTNAMIARLEASIAASRSEMLRVESEAAQAQESLLSAGEERDVRTAEAEKAVKQLDLAKTYLDQSRQDLGAIASDIYRNGAGTSTLGLLLDNGQDGDLFYKAATIDALSDKQTRSVNNATKAEALLTAWQEYANAAQSASEEAAKNYDSAARTATSTLTAYQSSVEPGKKLRAELISNLATLKEKEEAEVRQAIEAKEAQEQEAALEEAIAQADSTDIPVKQEAEIQPLAVEKPQELVQSAPPVEAEAQPEAPKVEIKPEATTPPVAPKPAPVPSVKPEPTKTAESKPEPTQAPEPSKSPEPKPSVTPKPTQSAQPKPTKTAEPKPEPTQAPKPTQTAKPKPEPTQAPKPTQTAKPKPTPTQTQAPKPKPTPKPTQTAKPKPKPEVTPQSGGNYSAAISWALATANDPSKYYVYGANGPNAFDCSSFSQRAFGKSGISLPRTSSQQFFNAPQYVSLSNLRPGDLVFSSSNGGSSFYHVAIYIGNGNVVHARNPNAGISVTPLSWVNNLYSKAARY